MIPTAIKDRIGQVSDGLVPQSMRQQVTDNSKKGVDMGRKGVDVTLKTFGLKKEASRSQRMVEAAKRHPGFIAALVVMIVAVAGGLTAKPKRQD